MNILILNDDGPSSHGLLLLRDAAERHWRNAHIVTMSPSKDCTGASMGCTGAWKKAKAKEVEKGNPHFLQFALTPLGILVHAFAEKEKYLQHGTWDLVLSGVNLGANVGMSIFCSATVGVALYAAKAFGVPAWAFSQSTGPTGKPIPNLKGKEEQAAYRNAGKLLPIIFKTTKPWPGDCINVNFPAVAAKGPIETAVAAYDPYIGADHVPLEARKVPMDVEYLDDGYMTISKLWLEANPPQI